VFTGDPSPGMTKCIAEQQMKDRVHFAGVVPEPKLPGLYRGAVALVFPSLYEGFGLPVLEAMACGTPVVTANTTAIPEVAGDAALLVDPTSAEQIANSIEKIVNDNSLRLCLRNKGLARAAQFSWEQTKDRVKQVISQW
jgi:glycosyltransferase involved in cell wall biosynthesis